MTPDPDYTRPVEPGTFSYDPALAAAFGPDLTPGGFTLPPLLRDDPSELAAVVQPSSAEMPKAAAQRYQLHGEIARGGMGVVLKGRDPDLGRDLAFKVLRGELANKPAAVQRFVEEAQIGGQLQHPGVVPVYDLGRFADGRPYFAMKLVKGRTLADLFAARQSPADDRGRMLHTFLQVCQTVAYAHAKGVIHRDLKPSNVMVGGFGEVLVMDWGLAKVLPRGGIADEERASMASVGRKPPGFEEPTVIQTARSGSGSGSETQAGSVMGTPAFMPPEQAGGEIDKLDERADVFGLGAMLCVLLTGQPPYVAASGDEVRLMAVRGKLADAFARLDACAADAELVTLCKRCLSAEREDRPRDAEAVATAVQHYLSGVEERVRKAEVERAAAEARAEAEVKTRQLAEAKAAAERKRRLTQLALLATVSAVVVSAVGGGLWLWGERLAKQARARQLVETHLERAESELVAERVKEASAALALAEPYLADADSPELADRYAQDVKDRDMVKELEVILEEHWLARMEKYQFTDSSKTVERYVAAFRDHGLPVGELSPQELADRVVRSHIPTTLTAGLNYWYFLDPTRRDLREVLASIDPDQTRCEIRSAVDNGEENLNELVAGVDWAGAPVWFTVALGSNERLGDEVAIRSLKKAWYTHPSSHALAWRIGERMLRSSNSSTNAATVESVGWFRAAVALRPSDSAAHNYLGMALFMIGGNPAEILVACRTALWLDPRLLDSRVIIIQTLARTEDWDGLITEYSEYKRRKMRPTTEGNAGGDYSDGYGLGMLAVYEDVGPVPDVCRGGRPYLALRFAREFMTTQPAPVSQFRVEGDLNYLPERYNAACAAMLCAAGKGTDCPPPPDWPALRREALGYLKLDLAMWQTGFDINPDRHRNEVHDTISHWLGDADLKPVREPEGIATLPAVEQAEWQSFWAEVRKLHADSKPEVLPPPREDK